MHVWCEGAHHVMAADDSVVAAVVAGDVTGFLSTPGDLAVASSAWPDDRSRPDRGDHQAAPSAVPMVEREVRAARSLADLLVDHYWATDRRDGYVTVPVPPLVWGDAEATLAAAVALRRSIDRRNALIGIVGAADALGAATACAARGISLNVDLLVSADQVVHFAAAFLSGAVRGSHPAGRTTQQMTCVLTLRAGLLTQELTRRLSRLGEPAVLAVLAGEAQPALAADAISRFRIGDHLRLMLVVAGPGGTRPVDGPPDPEEVAMGSRSVAMLRDTGVDLEGAAEAATQDAAARDADLVSMAGELASFGGWPDLPDVE